MAYIKSLKLIFSGFWFEVILFTVLLTLIIYSFAKYKKGFFVARYYLIFIILITVAHIIQVLKQPLKPGSFLDILGVAIMIILFIVGIINIRYGERKAKIEREKKKS